MSRPQQLTLMAAKLLHAARAQDWQALQAADSELAQTLPALAALGPWDAAERSALERLEKAHAMARALCDEACAAVGQQLVDLREGREGWLAYALHDSSPTSEARP
ncbi:MAG TPA: hypothetical protein VMS38_00850 [Pseudorhodoferax sp.]|jgi:hypothetical protein|nr:hypothetical protein [Pseudorhodoferax sp.]